jgi:pimeloyl-ACP methyl ester carboxylesterase
MGSGADKSSEEASLSLSARTLVALALAGALAGCVFLDVKEQQKKLQAACTIKGTARSVHEDPRPLVVLLLRRGDDPAKWEIASHFVMERDGRFVFKVNGGKGSYTVAAFEDADRDLSLGPNEPFVTDKDTVTCASGELYDGFVLNIPASRDGRTPEFDVASFHSRTLTEQMSAVFGQTVAVGELTSLAEDIFRPEMAETGLWRPFDFLVEGNAGIYFLETYDATRIPVLFVHGINDTPARFAYLIDRLDHKRFQAWVYYYPSGLPLATVADQLNQTVIRLQTRYRVQRLAVVAHSMGGLVSRGFIQRHEAAGGGTEIPLFVTLSTPWGGARSAESGVKNAPVVVEVWRDMAPGSDYQQSLFTRPLPTGMRHHMVFTFQRKNASFGESDDQSVSVASQLAPPAQRSAVRVYGFDDTHVGVLRNPEVSKLLNELLAHSF